MRMVLIGLSREMEYELRNRVFEHLTKLAPRYYQRNRIGEVMSRATNDMSAVRMVLGPGHHVHGQHRRHLRGLRGADAVDLAAAARCWRSCRCCFVSWLVRHYGRQVHDRYEEVQAQLAEMNALVQENLSGARVVRAYAQEAAEERRFALANREYVAPQQAPDPHHRHPAPRDRLPDGPGLAHGAVAGRAHGGRGRGHARRVRGVRRLPGDAALADDRARLGGEPVRARRGVDGAHPRDPRRSSPRFATRRRSPWAPSAARSSSAA